jgi:hypothetical protein
MGAKNDFASAKKETQKNYSVLLRHPLLKFFYCGLTALRLPGARTPLTLICSVLIGELTLSTTGGRHLIVIRVCRRAGSSRITSSLTLIV